MVIASAAMFISSLLFTFWAAFEAQGIRKGYESNRYQWLSLANYIASGVASGLALLSGVIFLHYL